MAVGNCVVRITDDALSIDEAYDSVHHDGVGAIVCFVGTVRNHFNGRDVKAVNYEAYREMAEKELKAIGSSAMARWPESQIAIYHRLGHLDVREKSLVTAVSSPHRDAAYACSRFVIEKIKRLAPIWKQEYYVDGDLEWHDEPKRP